MEEYYYYPTSAKATTNLSGDRITEISQDTDESGGSADNSIYVRYKVGTDVGFGTSHPHLLKFLDPLKEGYYLEDGSDKLTTGKIQAIYPYCNGDGSLNIYGQVMRDEQMDGGSSTRPRWIWYFESANSDPYHVKIHSRSTISFGGRSNTTYLQTFAVHFNQDTDAPNKQHIVTGGNLIGITQDVATEYAILGVKNKYKLLTLNRVAADLNGDGDTSDTDENERRFVTSFEQYWKTYNMLKLCVLGIDKSTNEFSTDPSTFVVPSVDNPATDDVDESTFRATLAAKDWHSYNAVANATRWNGYNDVEGSSGLEKKKVERLEHWFQTFSMGDGTFDIEDADIPPVLVLLDRHGWEIMRKPIPLGDADLQADEKLAELRVFDSPMVKEYKFYSNANKDSGCHRYVLRIQNGAERDPIKVGGVHFTSTSLATLPPYVADRDLFVTYTVKEEYEKSYQPDLKTASKFIVLQNHQYAKDNSSTLTAVDAPSNISNTIIADDALAEGSKTFNQDCLWYVQPNSDIDTEMGYPGAAVSYTDDQNGFDPYNLQLKNASTSKFFTIDMKRSVLSGGVYTGDYTGGTLNVTLAAACTSPVASTESYDHSTLQMTNQTFMAVQDVNGNMQLMPRFDHAHRIDAFTTLAAPLAHATTADVDDASPGSQTTFMVRPLVFNYRILDNEGNVAMHYKAAGESYPSMPEHFKSPLAKDFKFYSGQAVYTATESTAGDWEAAGESFKKTAINNGGMNGQIRDFTTIGDYYFRVGSDTYTYTKVTVTNGNTTSSSNGIYDDVKEGRDISAREITSSFAAAGLQTSADIFIRYSYDEDHDTDNDNILQGRWMTMSLGGYNVQYDGTLNADGSGIFKDADPATKPATINSDAAAKKWQWKFLQSPCVSTSLYYKAPDPYAVRISNREANNGDPLDENSPMSIAIKVDDIDRFVLLAHPSGDYAFAAAGDELSYSFLNGASMTAPSTTPASIEAEGSFTKAANTISAGARVIFSNEVTHTFRYNIITNGKLLAAYEDQTDAAAFANHYAPLVPENIQSALINVEDYLYYGTAPLSDSKYTIDENSQIDNLYGLYDDIVYVHYPEFDRDKTPYLVPNERSSTSPVAVASTSNDVAIDLNGNLPYNIIWLSDNMMTSTDGSAISDGGDMSHQLSATTADMWHFTGNDPYAIKIKHESGDHYLNSTATLADESSAKTYMLLKHDGYDYGVLAESGNQGTMLSGYGQTTVTGGTAPTKFIPFALSVHHLIYHLVINTSNVNTSIPYRETKEGEEIAAKATWEVTDVTDIKGTTQRDLTSGSPAGTTYQLGSTINGLTYSYDAGKVGLGDVLNVPGCFDRPNCQFYYYIQDVYDSYNEGTHECSGMNTTLNNKYKGLKLEKLMSDGGLIGKTVVVNIAYKFDTGLETNAGGDFVTSTGQNLWYTFETSGATPKLAQYTGSLQTVSGYATHYTNDYLWTPLGDPYGFKMYNRYMHKNLTQTTTVMTTTSIADNQSLEMRSDNDANSVYELLADESTTAGYFLVHPVVNNDGTQYYMCDNGGTMKLSTTATEWTYGLSEDVMRPYYVGAGNVGGLNAAGKAAYEKAAAITDPFTKLVTLQDVVYNHDKADDDEDNYIVHYTPGYYRLHSQPGSEGLSTVRYASGYLHDIEKDVNKDGNEADAIPMHFYSRVGVNTTFEDEGGLTSGFTKTAATRGPIPVPATEYDPSSIFYFSGSSGSINISTQGLNVVGNKMTTSTGTSFTITDIGGGIIALSNSTNYLCYKQEGNIYDLKYGSYPSMESARWCMEPANNQGLVLTTNDGGEGYFYTTFCAPYDVLLPANSGSNSYYAYVCTAWDTEIIHPVKVRASDPYAEGKFVPAGTPVIIRTTDNTGKVQLTLPSSSPTSSLSCTFTGKYLEQLLATEITSSDKVYTFGLPITGYTITTTSGSDNGVIGSLVNREDSKTGVGFYVNANPNKELGDNTGAWTPNNRYVLHNKIYYRSGGSGASARSRIPAPQFIPVVFDGIEEVEQEGVQLTVEDDRVYDVHGRCIVSGEQARDGSWKKSVPSGVYLQGGKKYLIRKRTEM